MTNTSETNATLHSLSIPRHGHDENLDIDLHNNERLFIVGANGSGKSALVHHFVRRLGNNARLISAHRQNWMPTSTVDMRPTDVGRQRQNIANHQQQPQARWRDISGEQGINVLLYDLLAAEYKRLSEIGKLADQGEHEQIPYFVSHNKSIFERLNDLLKAGNLNVQIDKDDQNQTILAYKAQSEAFNIEKLSDGERNALILACNILTCDSNKVLIIDEPERHLHQSIVEPLLFALFEERNDCAFIISTHDIQLPITHRGARTLVTRECRWSGNTPASWDVEILEHNNEIPDDIKYDILGSKKKILFVEGTYDSLDYPLYSAIFPEVSVIPKNSCNEVIRCTQGVNESYGHWSEAYGLIDRDDRTEDEIEQFREDNIFALNVHSAEAIYYSKIALKAAAQYMEPTSQFNSQTMLQNAQEKAIGKLRDEETKTMLCAKKCERRLREKATQKLPRWKDIKESQSSYTIDLPLEDEMRQKTAQYEEFLDNQDLDGLIANYPVRQSQTLDLLVRELGLNREQYERFINKKANQDTHFSEQLRGLTGSLAEYISTEERTVSDNISASA